MPIARLRVVPFVVALLAPAAMLLVGDAGAQQPAPEKPKPAPSASIVKPKIPKTTTSATPNEGEEVGGPKKPIGQGGPPPKPEDLWVGATTDEMIVQLEKRAMKDGTSGGRAAIGAIMAIPQLADEAKAGAARASLERIAKALGGANASADARALAVEAATIARSIAPDAGTASGKTEDGKLGIVSAWRIVGPFKDNTGTGLTTAEGPEIASPNAEGAPEPAAKKKNEKPQKTDKKASASDDKPRPVSVDLFRQLDMRWDDGAYDVSWRAVPPEMTGARGIPLDVLIYPRKETCSYLASAVSVPNDGPIVVHVSASGAVRAMFDGAKLGESDEQHALALADRIAAKVDTTKGLHLLALKVCAGPNPDAGRVRARVTGPNDDAIAGLGFADDLSKLPSALTPPKVTPLQTPLQKALSVTEKGSTVDEALAAALARRIGGADDLRSPRTQGLLDVVVTSNPRPDVLAIAGWLAPARGSATSWLNTALERTSAGVDKVYEPVAKFTRRTLADMRLDAGYVDWASSTVATTELKSATDLDAKIIRARLLEGLGQEEASFAAWKSIWDEQKEATPTFVLRAIGATRYGRPLVTAAALEQALKVWPRESARAFVRSRRMLGAEAVKKATIDAFRLLSTADELESLSEELDEAGLVPERRHFLMLSTQWAPNRKFVFSELAQSLAASSDAKERELAKDALERARQLDPGSPFLRAEEDLAFGENHPDDEKYMPDPKSFLARRKGAPKPAPDGTTPPLDVYDRELDWVRVVTVDDAGRVVQLIHYSREIVKAPKDSSDLDEPHVPAEGDIVEVVRARVHRLDGTTAVPQEIDEGEGIGIRWTDLKPGDVVEVATRSYTELPIGDRGAAPFYFLDYAGGPTTHPVLYNEVVVRSPKKHALFTALLHDDAGKVDVHTNETEAKTGRTIERYVWNNPIQLPEEPLQPKASEIYPTIIGSQFKTWDDFVNWYKAGVGSFSTVDPRIKRQAEEIVKKAKATTRDQKLNAIFDWIADQVKYVNYVSAEQWLPNRPQNVLDRMQGDCDDKAMLLITMLKAIGITEAQEVLVQTRYTGMPSIINAKGAVAPLFDHGIAFLPGGGKDGKGDRYLDATSPESRIGPLPAMDARAAAIRVIFGGTTPVVSLPSSDPSEHSSDATWTIALEPTGAAAIGIDEIDSGDQAFWLRTSLKQQSAAATWLEKYHAIAALPQIEVATEGVKFDGELPQGKASLKFHAKSAALARREGSDLVLRFHYGVPDLEDLAPLPTRVTPVELPPHMAPAMSSVKFVVAPPAGYKLLDTNPGGSVDGGSYGKASLTFEKGAKGELVVKRTFTLDQSSISVAEYPKWRDFLVKVDALFRREVRFVKGG